MCSHFIVFAHKLSPITEKNAILAKKIYSNLWKIEYLLVLSFKWFKCSVVKIGERYDDQNLLSSKEKKIEKWWMGSVVTGLFETATLSVNSNNILQRFVCFGAGLQFLSGFVLQVCESTRALTFQSQGPKADT